VNITRPCAQSPVAGSETWSRGYGAEDRRHRAEQGGVGRTFAYGVWNSVAGLTQVSGFPFQVFPSVVWGLDLSGSLHGAGGVGGLLMWLQPQSVGWSGDLELRPHWYTYDGNGNVSDLVSGEWDFTNFLDPTFSSALENHYEYGAFGEIVAATENRPENPFRFSTKWHEGNGLVYYGCRYYSAGKGRWLSRDPIAEEGGINLYGYVSNNPVNLVDPFGLDWSDAAKAIWTAAGYAVPGSEFPGAAMAAADIAKIALIEKFKKACEKCLCEDGDCYGAGGVCSEYEDVKGKLQ